MDYNVLNKNQKDRMKAISDPAYVMKWEAPEFMDYLLGVLPKVRKYQKDKEVEHEIASLEKVLTKYDAFFSEKSTFLHEVAKRISDIHNLKDSWCGLSLYEIETYVKLHSFCLISGEGGIGKSYFIKCFEEQLEQKNIEHLCIYGKFEKNTNNIDVEEIIRASRAGFVFIVDAINEMSEEGQHNLLGVLTELKKYPRIRVVISYRTNSMDNMILKKYQEISEYEYKFPGVSFESALSEILKLSVPDVYMYEDILYSNNALLLSMLCDVLSSKKIVDETENGIASITFILEQYVKKTIGKVFKDHLTCQGIDVWKDTKRVAQWMYRNGEKHIDENSLLSVIKTGENFLPSMIQMGFMDCYESDNKKRYYFVIDSLTDFLIARSLFEDIRGKKYEEQISIIKSKIESLYNLEEALIIAIFDNMSPDYEKIKNLLIGTELTENLDFNTLVKVYFKRENIATFLRMFKPIDHSTLLQAMGGYTDKPFNCSNYLFNYYCASRERLCDLSNTLSGYRFQNGIKNRLKNVLYFTTLNDREDRRDDEAFSFGLLCCAAPNKDVRCLAMKLLYEVVSKNEGYVDRLIVEYEKIFDFYIQEAIIYVLSQIKKDNGKILDFYNKIIEKQDNLTAKSIRRISTYFGNPYVINSLEMPVPRDVHWVRNVELTRRNVLHLLEKIKLKHQEWVMLAGRVSLHEEDKYDMRWRDTYDLWCCTSENETINDDGNARYLTIELEEYLGELKAYPDNTLKPWLCKDVKNINGHSEVFEETSLVLPPSEIVSFLNLKLNVSDLSWETHDKEKVIICNNNKNSYYRDPVGGTVFIRKDYFDKFLEEHTVKYFAFTERLIPETGYADETSLHFEIIDGKIVKEIKNAGGYGRRNSENNPLCSACPHTNIVEDDSLTSDIEFLKIVLAEYGIADDFDMLEEEDIL